MAAFFYGLLLIDQKARERGVFIIPKDPRDKVLPEIDVKALIEFTQKVATRISGHELSCHNGTH